eukprot:5497129-Pyramimonas_sp.AAC.1
MATLQDGDQVTAEILAEAHATLLPYQYLAIRLPGPRAKAVNERSAAQSSRDGSCAGRGHGGDRGAIPSGRRG